ncbi:hypothetical protein RMSM_02689, partial [Rhodopirellula maiorica SM1]
MTDTSASRPLRFEQLETRSLLAGGIFIIEMSFGTNQTSDSQNGTAAQIASGVSSASDIQRRGIQARFQDDNVQGNVGRENGGQNYRGSGNSVDHSRHLPTSFRQDIPHRQETTLAQAEQSATPATLGVSSTTGSQTNPTVNGVANDRRDVAGALPQNNNALVIPSAVDEILASLEPSGDGETSLDDQDAIEAVETVSTISAENADAVAGISGTTDTDAVATSLADTSDMKRTESESLGDLESGLITPDSTFQLPSLQSLSDSEHDPWQLDDSILPRLQQHFRATLR